MQSAWKYMTDPVDCSKNPCLCHEYNYLVHISLLGNSPDFTAVGHAAVGLIRNFLLSVFLSQTLDELTPRLYLVRQEKGVSWGQNYVSYSLFYSVEKAHTHAHIYLYIKKKQTVVEGDTKAPF